MATAASLEGIETFGGLGWKALVTIKLPDIPASFAETYDMTEMVTLAHTICNDLIESLKKGMTQVRILELIPSEAFEWLDLFVEEMEEAFVFEDVEQITNMSKESLLASCDGMEEELIHRLNELYDWADYWRVCFSTQGKGSV